MRRLWCGFGLLLGGVLSGSVTGQPIGVQLPIPSTEVDSPTWRIPLRLPQRIRMLFAGDLMQHIPQVTAARRGDGFDYTPVFGALRERFAAADLVVVNLETTLTRDSYYTGYPCFRSPAALADAMRKAGVDVAVTANNHCCDNGARGIRTTIEELERCGIARTGVFADSTDFRRNNPLYVTRNGIRLALLNYTYGMNGIPAPKGMIVNRIDTINMAFDLREARAQEVDFIAVCIHWGIEYQRRENAEQRALAAFLQRHGVDVVIGSHPHVAQPWRCDGRQVVVYSLGNFVSNQRDRYTDGGLLAEVEAVKESDGTMRYELEVTPVWVALPHYRVLPPEVADTLSLPASYDLFREDLRQLVGADI